MGKYWDWTVYDKIDWFCIGVGFGWILAQLVWLAIFILSGVA